MKDDRLISLNAALKGLEDLNIASFYEENEHSKEAYTEVKTMLKALPPAQPERKRGKWIYGEDEYGIDGYHCDKCGFFVPWDYAHKFINYIEDYKFCPNCGADMRGEQDE